jgi:hypothetical protein
MLNININIHNNKEIFKCLLCNKEYQYRTGLFKHKKTNHKNYDKEVKKLEEVINENSELEKLKELFITENQKLCFVIDKQQKEIELLNKKIKNLTNNSNNNTTNNTINNTINNNTINNNTTNIIIAFGTEEYENLNKAEIKKILFNHKVDPLLGIIEYIHFNDRLPQQQNIKYNNLRSKEVDIHNGKEWEIKNLDNVLDDLLENNIYNLDKIYDMITEEYKPKIKQIVRTIIDDYNEHYKLDTEERSDKNNKKLVESIVKTKNDVKLCLYSKTRNKKNNK